MYLNVKFRMCTYFDDINVFKSYVYTVLNLCMQICYLYNYVLFICLITCMFVAFIDSIGFDVRGIVLSRL